MSDRFEQVIISVRQKFADLCVCPKHRIRDLPKDMPSAGVYLFSEDGHILYVGRTNKLRTRLQSHLRNNHNQATFAFLLARHQTGNLKASYQSKGSRKDLLNDPEFRAAFDSARERIMKMDVQFVEEKDPIRQTILEVFTAYETGAKFNDFDNH
jgi:excinuclease UvrABC nuclease subunit